MGTLGIAYRYLKGTHAVWVAYQCPNCKDVAVVMYTQDVPDCEHCQSEFQWSEVLTSQDNKLAQKLVEKYES